MLLQGSSPRRPEEALPLMIWFLDLGKLVPKELGEFCPTFAQGSLRSPFGTSKLATSGSCKLRSRRYLRRLRKASYEGCHVVTTILGFNQNHVTKKF